MMSRYAGTYSDSGGQVPVVLSNDGVNLSVDIRGVIFSGRDFDSLEPDPETPERLLRLFTLSRSRDLAGCEFSVLMPIPVVVDGNERQGQLQIDLELGFPTPSGNLDRERLRLTLRHSGEEMCSTGQSGSFEGELLELERQLPGNDYIRSCFFCLYSDYSPFGNGLFGTMMCFRNIKSEYLLVKSKADFWTVHDRFERQVQETYLCAEFARRSAGTGYRG